MNKLAALITGAALVACPILGLAQPEDGEEKQHPAHTGKRDYLKPVSP